MNQAEARRAFEHHERVVKQLANKIAQLEIDLAVVASENVELRDRLQDLTNQQQQENSDGRPDTAQPADDQ